MGFVCFVLERVWMVSVRFCRNKDGGVEEASLGKQLEAGLREMDRDGSLSKATA